MIVRKDDKHLYAFLKNAFNIMGYETSNKFLMGDGSELYFSTMNIKGKIEIMCKEIIKGKPQDTGKHNFDAYFYTLKMLDDKSFELKEIKNDQQYQEERQLITGAFKAELIPVCDIDEGCEIVLSKIALNAGFEVPDRYINQLKRLGPCKVYKNRSEDQNIVCIKNDYFEKEKETVKTSMIFACDTWESFYE